MNTAPRATSTASTMTTTTKLAVGQIPYLNAAPFYLRLEDGPFDLFPHAPRGLAAEARAGRVDAGPLALVDFWRLEPEFERLRDFGIAVRKAAGSVLLFSRWPLAQLDGATIGVTDESSTSVLLLKLLLQARHRRNNLRYVPLTDEGREPAVLLIGDAALRGRLTLAKRFPYLVDLGAEWWQWQLRPFTFAVWAVRRSVDPERKALLAQRLGRALTLARQDWGAIVASRAAAWHQSPEELERYLKGFSYRLGPEEMEGLQRFHRLLEEHGLWP